MGDIPKDGTSIKVDDLSSDDTLTNLQDIPGDDTSVFSEATPDDKPEDICLIEYLFKRLYQLGVRSICGVPGDYNLTALDYVQPCGLRWVGNANELNAAYAADGYARLNGVSVLMTVMGVGELSAMNAIAGAYTEKVPIVHIVGMPSTRSQQLKQNLHHSLGDGDFGRFSTLHKSVTCGQIMLDGSSAVMQVMIDDILRQCLRHSRPVYIGLPTDLIKRKVSAGRLVDEPLLRAENAVTRAQKIQHSRVMAVNIRATVQKYRRPVVVVDGFASQYGFVKAVNQLARFSGIPTFTTPFGKGIVDETCPNFHGIYTGAVWWSSDDEKWVYPDFCLYIAPLKADTNTCCFTAMSGVSKVIEIGQHDVSIKSASLRCDSKTILEILSMPPFWHIPVKLDPRYGLRDRKGELERLPGPCADAVIDQDSFWFRISKFFKPGDVILTETGTASLGGQDFVLPPATKMINSGAWLSIGYTLGASVGAALAQADARGKHPNPTKGRTILFEGDGSFQMTAQAVSDIIRNRLDVIIFLINNDGYTIERLINGMDADYNAVQPWNYLESASYFGAPKNDPSYPVFAKRANNWGELYEIIKEPQLVSGKGFNMVEVMMRKEDATASLKEMVQLSKQQNSGKDTLA